MAKIKIKRTVTQGSSYRPPRLVWAKGNARDGLYWIPGVGLALAVGDKVVHYNEVGWQSEHTGHLKFRSRKDLDCYSGVRRVDLTPEQSYKR